LLLCNALYVGFTVQASADFGAKHNRSSENSASWIEYFFLAAFSSEIALRLVAFQQSLCDDPDWGWNLFDAGMVLMMWADAIVLWVAAAHESVMSFPTVLRVLRILRIVKIVRAIRVLRFFRDLRLMITSLLNSAVPLFWVIVLLLFMFFLFGVTLTQGVVDYLNEHGAWEEVEFQGMRTNFGTLHASILSLYEAMSGGISWGELYDVLRPLHVAYRVIFLLYIALSIFAVENIVTGVFINSAFERSKSDREAQIQNAMADKEVYLQKMQSIFHEMDADKSGNITLQELQDACCDERMDAYFDALGLKIADVDMLFSLLDKDGVGHVGCEEFLTGCLRLKGEAKGIDVATMQYQMQWLLHNVKALSRPGIAKQQVQLKLKKLDNGASTVSYDNVDIACAL